MLKSGVPSLIIELLKDQVGIDRLGLEELAVLAATVEDLVHRDSVDLLELAYKARNLSTDEPLDKEDADLLIRTFALYFLLPASQKFAQSHQQAMAILERRVSRAYPGWHDAMICVDSPYSRVVASTSRRSWLSRASASCLRPCRRLRPLRILGDPFRRRESESCR